MNHYERINIPSDGKAITLENKKLIIPDNPIIPFIEGDGIGPDIWSVTRKVIDAAVEKTFKGRKKIAWMEIYAGEKAIKRYGENIYLPSETVEAIKEFRVAIKGPLTTPVGKGVRSINVALRMELDLFALIRPVKYYSGAPSPVKNPRDLDVVVVRENTEDVFTGTEFRQGSEECEHMINYINGKFGKKLKIDSGITIKSISKSATERLVKKAFEYAVEHGRKSITLVHKGNIMKFTEGSFKEWGYETAEKYFGDIIIYEDQLSEIYGGVIPHGKILVKDRIADTVFQQILLKPKEYDVFATPNLIGDFLSDACAAQVGGLGIAPGANFSDDYALFEAAHGSAPKYAGLNKVNPTSLILSGVMMLNFIGWNKAARLVEKAIVKSLKNKKVTYDFARIIRGSEETSCSGLGDEIIKNMYS